MNRRNNYKVSGHFAAPVCKLMIEHQNTVIVIAARMASRGLAGKPMADLVGKPVIAHAWARALESKLGHVLVAAPEFAICDVIRQAGGEAIVTPPQLSSHVERVSAALKLRDSYGQFQNVIVLPGDMVTLDAQVLRRTLAGLTNAQVDVAVAAVPLRAEDANDPDIIKIVTPLDDKREVAFVRDFNRGAGEGGASWRFAGVCAYRRTALDRLAVMPPSLSERDRHIELMRAFDYGHKIAAVQIDEAPFRISSRAALDEARQILKAVP
jgi:3-deoxy-manno-octulosonate cytidylyltransferase (CMP-KDO synthetase)